MIDLRTEKPLLFAALAKRLGVQCQTVRKWWKRGVLLDRSAPSKGKVRLEAIRLTNGFHTSEEAYQRFVDRMNEARGIQVPLSNLREECRNER
jgi:hypothetical protein